MEAFLKALHYQLRAAERICGLVPEAAREAARDAVLDGLFGPEDCVGEYVPATAPPDCRPGCGHELVRHTTHRVQGCVR